MKFLVDAQLPFSLSELLKHNGYDSIHTSELLKGNATSDQEIIEILIKENRVLISKDKDFLESYLIRHLPRKLLIVGTGNISNAILKDIFSKNIKRIVEMLNNTDLIEINQQKIIER